jgi:hypothetical protein
MEDTSGIVHDSYITVGSEISSQFVVGVVAGPAILARAEYAVIPLERAATRRCTESRLVSEPPVIEVTSRVWLMTPWYHSVVVVWHYGVIGIGRAGISAAFITAIVIRAHALPGCRAAAGGSRVAI